MPPPKVLSVAEKPSIAKSLAQVFGGARRRQSHDTYSCFWDLPRVPIRLDGQRVEVPMTITSVRGHIQALDFEPEYKTWSSCSPGALFLEAQVRKFVPQDMAGLLANLEEGARQATVLMLWLDCDREGENIAFEVIEICRKANRHLRVVRARFSAVTPTDVFQAVNNLVEPDARQSAAVDARQEIDLRLGAAFTRFQTLSLQNRFEGLVDHLVSYGPCQFPCLGFVAERQAKVRHAALASLDS
mmetsp:Transcript_19383/g.58606  ORF Transcript_19383/g.58606 Transcript_19383/m.58606 type:complete len:243 (+) Transcript_19383:59-787(+)